MLVCPYYYGMYIHIRNFLFAILMEMNILVYNWIKTLITFLPKYNKNILNIYNVRKIWKIMFFLTKIIRLSSFNTFWIYKLNFLQIKLKLIKRLLKWKVKIFRNKNRTVNCRWVEFWKVWPLFYFLGVFKAKVRKWVEISQVKFLREEINL